MYRKIPIMVKNTSNPIRAALVKVPINKRPRRTSAAFRHPFFDSQKGSGEIILIWIKIKPKLSKKKAKTLTIDKKCLKSKTKSKTKKCFVR